MTVMLANVGLVRVGVPLVEELNDMKSAAVHIEMDIPLLEIRREGLPDLYLGMQLLDRRRYPKCPSAKRADSL